MAEVVLLHARGRFRLDAPMAADDVVESPARLALFSDLPPPQLEALAHGYDEPVFSAGTRVFLGRRRLRPAQQPLEDREAAEHPAGCFVRRGPAAPPLGACAA